MEMIPDAVPSTLRKINIRGTLELLKLHGECSRADLTRMLRVSAPTMSKLLDKLLQDKFIEEFTVDPVGKGRPSKMYRLAEKSVFIAGVVIDIIECRAVCAGLDGKFRPSGVINFSTPGTYEELIKFIAGYVKESAAGHSGSCLGVGVSVPGLINSHGYIELSPNIPMLNGKNIRNDLRKMLDCKVCVVQEEYGMCMAEKQFGSSASCPDFVLVDISSGLGMGVFSGNRYVHGSHGFGGELGHITVKPDGPLCSCGNYGCLEMLAGDKAIAGKLSEKLGREVKCRDLIRVVQEEGLDISAELEEAIYYLSIGIANVINLFNPSRVVIHGAMFDLDKKSFSRLKQTVKRRALPPAFATCVIQRSKLIKIHGAIAAICAGIFESTGPQIDR
jgi:N-acetylglucosamine repressor